MTEVRAAVLGASGYTGGELLRLLALHPRVEVVYATSREYKGMPVYRAHPSLRGFYEGLRFSEAAIDKVISVDLVFNAMPHGVGVEYTSAAYDHGVTVIDLSADYRLSDPRLYERLYGFTHPRPDLLSRRVYGLPELYREEIHGSRLISIPGCNATAALLASAPIVVEGLVEEPPRIVVDVKAGSSERGSKASKHSHHPEREGALRPYSPWIHRHAFEVSQELSRLSKSRVTVSMVPHAVSMVRGVMATVYAWAKEGVGFSELARAYSRAYSNSVFVRLKPLSPGLPTEPPDVKNVIGSNFAEIGYSLDVDNGRIAAFTAIDNLVKGASGQAIQSMNLALGFPEEEGLWIPPIRP